MLPEGGAASLQLEWLESPKCSKLAVFFDQARPRERQMSLFGKDALFTVMHSSDATLRSQVVVETDLVLV